MHRTSKGLAPHESRAAASGYPLGLTEICLTPLPGIQSLGMHILDGLPLLHWIAGQLAHETDGMLRRHRVALCQTPEHLPQFSRDIFLPELRIAQQPRRSIVDYAETLGGELD